MVLKAIKDKKLLPVTELDRGFVHPTEAAQVIVSYFQGGRICDYINEKWGWDTLLAMLHDFGAGEETAAVIRKELKIEPEEFDKRFFAFVEADTKKQVDHFEQYSGGMKLISELAKSKAYDAIIKEGEKIQDWYPDYVEDNNLYEILAKAYLETNNKPAAMAELERYVKIGGRNPETIKKLAKMLVEAGRKKDAADVLARLNYIYPLDNEAHQLLGSFWLEQGNASGAMREFRAVVAHNPIDPAEAHYDLARAFNSNHQPDQAKDELFTALEAAPGYRPAQRLLLELTADKK